MLHRRLFEIFAIANQRTRLTFGSDTKIIMLDDGDEIVYVRGVHANREISSGWSGQIDMSVSDKNTD